MCVCMHRSKTECQSKKKNWKCAFLTFKVKDKLFSEEFESHFLLKATLKTQKYILD